MPKIIHIHLLWKRKETYFYWLFSCKNLNLSNSVIVLLLRPLYPRTSYVMHFVCPYQVTQEILWQVLLIDYARKYELGKSL